VAAASQAQIIPPAAAHFRGLSFSRDGEFLYFVAADWDNEKGALFQVPVLGGPPRKLLTDIQSPITFSPDGKHLAFVRYASPKENVLIVSNFDGSEARELAKHSSPDFFSTMAPAWSPDGSLIACVYQNTSGGYYENVVSVSIADGTEAPITPQRWWQVGQVVWLADGKGLIASATEEAGSLPQLWYLPYKGGAAKRITNDLNGYVDVSLTADSKTLVSVQGADGGLEFLGRIDNQVKIDAVIRFYQVEWLSQLPRRAGWKNLLKPGGRTCVINPTISAISESKRLGLCLGHLSARSDTFRDLSPECREPHEIEGSPKEDWVLKATYANTGDEVHLGGEMSLEDWSSLLRKTRRDPHGWVAQRRFETLALRSTVGPVKPCVGVFVIAGRAAGAYVRLSRTQVTDAYALEAPLFIMKPKEND